MLEGHILEVEMDTFEQHIGRHEHFLRSEIHDRTVIADTFLGTRLHRFDTFGEMLDQAELAVF